MTQLAFEAFSTNRRGDVASLSDRLDDLAREMEAAGLPWAASGIRNVAGMIAAERQLAERLAA